VWNAFAFGSEVHVSSEGRFKEERYQVKSPRPERRSKDAGK
jgi:hypothetical protein